MEQHSEFSFSGIRESHVEVGKDITFLRNIFKPILIGQVNPVGSYWVAMFERMRRLVHTVLSTTSMFSMVISGPSNVLFFPLLPAWNV